ncbi:MAG: aldehyde dehydrogenase family protein [bacterium]
MTEVYKTYKILINGQLVRSESNRTYKVFDSSGKFIANVPRCTKKDLRDAVRVAKNALQTWENKSPYNRGQIIYRMAEETENRKYELANELKKHGVKNHSEEVQKVIDRLIHYAGWADKYSHILGTVNSVSTPFINYSVPEPVGVVCCITPSNPPLLSFITQVIPTITVGNVVVSVLSDNPLPVLTFSEIILASDVPPGVINILTQTNNELIDHLSKHMDIDLIHFIGSDKEIIDKIVQGGSLNLKRIKVDNLSYEDFFEDSKSEGISWIEKFLEIKTMWVPGVGN